MPSDYKARITRGAPGCIIMLLDVSDSMGLEFQPGVTRASFLADAVNRTLLEIGASCKRRDGVRHYFDIGMLIYGGYEAASAFQGELSGRDLVSTTDLAANPLRVETRNKISSDGTGGIVEVPVPFPVWFEAQHGGGTAMCAAFRKTGRLVAAWCAGHASSFPPIIMHITDGEANDGSAEDVLKAARQITEQKTEDGFALLMNLHIAGGSAAPIAFPWSETSIPAGNHFAEALYEASSPLPKAVLERSFKQGNSVQPGSRGYIYNGGLKEIVSFLDVGTQAATRAIVPSD